MYDLDMENENHLTFLKWKEEKGGGVRGILDVTISTNESNDRLRVWGAVGGGGTTSRDYQKMSTILSRLAFLFN